MNLLLDMPLALRLLLLFVLGACLGAVINLAVDRLRFRLPRLNPWHPTLDALLRRCGREPFPFPAAPPLKERSARGSKGKKKTPAIAARSWLDRLPIFGWMRLRREAVLYGNRFWLRPWLVEVITGFLLAWLYWWEVEHLGLVPFLNDAIVPAQLDMAAIHAQYARHALLLALMIAATLIDLDEWVIPDMITVPGTLAALALAHWPDSLLITATFPPPSEPAFLQVAAPNPFPSLLSVQQPLALWIALGCFWLWIVALLPRVLRLRRGWSMACAIFWKRLVQTSTTYWYLLLGLVGTAGIWLAWRGAEPDRWAALLSSLIGLAVGLIIIWGIRVLGTLIMRREAMGFGDVTLMGMIGAFLGWQPALMVLFIGPFFGLVPGAIQLLTRPQSNLAIPFGPFLCAGGFTVIVAWATLWEGSEHVFQTPWLIPAALGICTPVLVLLLLLLQLVKRLLGRGSS